MKRKIISSVCVLSLIVALSLALAGCGGTVATTTSTSGAPGEQKVLKIGSIVALTTAQGLEIQKWMNLLVKDVNDKGGWKVGNDTYTIEYTAYDCGFADATATRAATEKAVLQDGVQVLIGNLFNVEAVTATVTEPNKVLTLGCDASTSSMEKGAVNKYFFDAAAIYFSGGVALNLYNYYKEQGATDYIAVGQDAEQPRAIMQGYSAVAELVGLKILDPVYYAAGTVDMGPIATKIMSKNPTFVDLGPTSGDALVNLLTALHDAGYKGLICPGFLNEATLDKLVTKFGAEWFEGMKSKSTDPRTLVTDPTMVALYDSYVQEYGTFNSDGTRWVTPWFFFADAVAATQSVDSTVLADYLSKSTKAVQALNGMALMVARPDLQNNTTCQALVPNLVGAIRNGKLVSDTAVSLKDDYLATIKAQGLVSVYQQYWTDFGKPQFPEGPSLVDYPDLTN
jgi:ABC-type branched-subunit amino acid transport system substrate-binding protein